MRVGKEEADHSLWFLLVAPISTTAMQRCLLGVHIYGAGTPVAGVLAPRTRLVLFGKVEKGAARVYGARASSAHSPAPHYIDPTNGPSRQKLIRVLLFLKSTSNISHQH